MIGDKGCLLNGKPLPPKTTNRLARIKQLIGSALVEVEKSKTMMRWSKRPSEDSLEGETIEEILAHLHKGYLMTKHS